MAVTLRHIAALWLVSFANLLSGQPIEPPKQKTYEACSELKEPQTTNELAALRQCLREEKRRFAEERKQQKRQNHYEGGQQLVDQMKPKCNPQTSPTPCPPAKTDPAAGP